MGLSRVERPKKRTAGKS